MDINNFKRYFAFFTSRSSYQNKRTAEQTTQVSKPTKQQKNGQVTSTTKQQKKWSSYQNNRTTEDIMLFFDRPLAERKHTVSEDILPHLICVPRYSQKMHIFFFRKVAERNNRKVLFASFNLSILSQGSLKM